ncbi:MAG: glycosyltransferase family 2 protein [Kordiimonadaceae bacterium]|nr:glycosyltransferase family 2 protein [Kordiimonadaceae bacterium]
MSKVTLIVPVFNEADVIADFCAELTNVTNKISVKNPIFFEILLVDDGSSDNSAEIIQKMTKDDALFTGIYFSRNFGKEAAMLAGIEHATGDAVIVIDADFQHPAELISDMINKWQEGSHVVDAVKRKRAQSSFLNTIMASAFNHIMSVSTGRDMAGASDFKLLDRQVIDAIKAMPEKNRFFRGLVAWVGFDVSQIVFDTQPRRAGEKKWPFRSLLNYAINNIVAFTSLPLKIMGLVGFVLALGGGGLLLQTMVRYFSGHAVEGFTTVIAIQLITGGFILIAIGVISLYLSKIYNEIKGRPIYITKKIKIDDSDSV